VAKRGATKAKPRATSAKGAVAKGASTNAKPKVTKVTKAVAAPPAAKPKPKLPTVAVKPKQATKPSIPLPPPPPPPPAQRDELAAPRDIARLLRYGERLGDKRIDIKWAPQVALPITESIAMFDPAAPKHARVFDRPSGGGAFRTMLSIAIPDGKAPKLAAFVIHTGRPPIARWTVAHFAKDKKPKSPEALPRVASGSGWIAFVDGGKPPVALELPASTEPGPIELALPDGRKALAVQSGTGEFAAYWAVDATDKPICLVVDFDVLTQKDWKSKPT